MGFKNKPIPCVKITLFPNFIFTQAILVSIKPNCGLGVSFSYRSWRAVLFVCFLFIFFFHEAVVSIDGFPSPLFIRHHSTECIYEERQAAPK